MSCLPARDVRRRRDTDTTLDRCPGESCLRSVACGCDDGRELRRPAAQVLRLYPSESSGRGLSCEVRKRITDYANENDHPLCGASDVPQRPYTTVPPHAVLRRQGERPGGSLTGTVVVGAEAALTDNWTVETSAYWNPIRTERLTTQVGAVQLGVRHWFYEDFVGHFLGLHASWVDYRIGNRRRTYDGRAYGIGVSYGYAWIALEALEPRRGGRCGGFIARATRAAIRSRATGVTAISATRGAGRSRSDELEVSFNYLF